MSEPLHLGQFISITDSPVVLDMEALVGSHMAIVANTGGGKSGLIRVLCETTHGHIQQIIFDDQGEFYTLREKLDYVIAGGDEGDVPISLANARDFALAVLEHGFSVIIDLSEMDERQAYLGAFLEALVDAPKRLWHPVLVVIDEAQRYAPQGEIADSSHGVRALTERGRKRGFTAVLASQRLAKIDKNVTGDVKTWFLGSVGQSIDRRTVADALGFPPSSTEARGLTGLPTRHFWTVGPAVGVREPSLMRAKDAETTMVRAGQAHVPTPPPPEALRAILEALKPPPAPEEPETDAPAAGGPSRAEIDAIRERARAEGHAQGHADGQATGIALGRAQVIGSLKALLAEIEATPPPAAPVQVLKATTPASTAPAVEVRSHKPTPPVTVQVQGELSRPSLKILEAYRTLWPQAIEFKRAAGHAGVGLKSSQFHRYEPELQASGALEEVRPHVYRAREANGLSGADLLAAYASRLSPAYQAILTVIRDVNGPRTRDEIATAAGVSLTSSTTAAALKVLMDLDVVEKLSNGRFQMAELFRP